MRPPSQHKGGHYRERTQTKEYPLGRDRRHAKDPEKIAAPVPLSSALTPKIIILRKWPRDNQVYESWAKCTKAGVGRNRRHAKWTENDGSDAL